MDTLDRIFAAAVEAHRDRPAIDLPPTGSRARRVLTYGELDRLADRLAEALPAPTDATPIVLLMLPRGGVEVYAAQLAATRRGLAFCATDAAFPDAHLAAVIADAGPQAIVTDPAGTARLTRLDAGIPILDATAITESFLAARDREVTPTGGRSEGSVRRTPACSTPDSLAYLISTSGTTGTPKAVMITHRSIANLVVGDSRFGFGPGDRIAQCSSPAYDSSLEETWLALASGATLVPADEEIVRSGPDLPAWLRAERITVFCPPPTLLRAMGVEDPRRELPELRFIWSGGEALPQDLSDLWSAALMLENGYGPTECTVTATSGRMRPGVPVHIGRAVPGNEAFIVGPDGAELADGEEGELCIAGVGVAAGYLRRPEETARRFGPVAGRAWAYRTGDLARRRPGGELEFLGRIDAQVKVRGVRIELGAVETCLASHPAVAAAACAVVGEGSRARLGAVVVARPDAPLGDPTAMLAPFVRERLPAAMVPAVIAVVEAVPTSVSGKVDRRAVAGRLREALPAEVAADPAHEATARDAGRPLEDRVRACIARTIGGGDLPAADADFFTDLGGDSLRAVELLLWLRRLLGAEVAVRDLYAGRTAEGIARRLRFAGTPPAPKVDRVVVRSSVPVAVVQAVVLLAGFILSGATAYAAIFLLLPLAVGAIGPFVVAVLLPFAVFLAAGSRLPLGIAATLLAKAILVGRYEPGRVEAWSGRHLREWIVGAVASWIPWGLIEGTELHASTLRWLGARIGRGVDLHRGVRLSSGGWDLVEIGDGAILERDARLLVTRLERGGMEWAPIAIGARSVVGLRATIEGGGAVGEGAEVEPLALVARGESVPAGRRWGGVPGADRGPAPPAPTAPRASVGPWGHAALVVLGRFLATASTVLGALAVGVLVARLDLARLTAWLESPWVDWRLALLACAASVVAVPAWLLLTALSMRWIMPLRPGRYPRHGLDACRIAVRIRTLDDAGRWISGTLLWPIWLRLAGMRIGRGSEVSTIIDTLPEVTSIGRMCFLADGIYLGGPTTRGEAIVVERTSLGDDTFLGNHAVIPAGRAWPDGMFVGVATVPPPDAGVGGGWFGSPPIPLPRREVVELDRRLTHEPTLVRRVNRWAWELARFGVALPPVAVALGWMAVVEQTALVRGPWATAFLWAPLASLGGWLALVAFGLSAKWVLLGRVKPGMHGLWSCWCSRWDYLYVLWWFSARAALDRVEGTPFLAVVLRLAGNSIGRGVLIGPGATQIVDPDMLRFDDRSTVACHFQAHSFEDRVLKIDRVRIGEDATAGENAVVMHGAEVGAGATLASASVLMKRGEVAPGSAACGSPVG